MKPSDCGKVLAWCNAFDNRQPNEAMMIAWSTAIKPGITVDQATAAVSAHYRESTAWCTPAHINALAQPRGIPATATTMAVEIS